MSNEYQFTYKSVLNIIDNKPYSKEWIIRKCTPEAFQDAVDKGMIKYYDTNELGIEQYKITDLGKTNR